MLGSLDIVTVLARYFTSWWLMLVIFSRYTHRYFDLLFLSTIVFVCGAYLTYVYPRRFTFRLDGETYVIDGWRLIVTDLVVHIAPFLYIVYKYGRYYIEHATRLPLINSLLLMAIYISVFDVFDVYGVRGVDLACASIVVVTATAAAALLTYMKF